VLGEAQANYDAVVAGYRQTVLTAFQQVEDNLSALRILAEESDVLQQSVKSAERSVTISTAQYKGGVASYLQVITVQAILLQTQRSAIDVQTRRMTASVLLVQALGGGWSDTQLPTVKSVSSK
jgi:outer membrane protein TolC